MFGGAGSAESGAGASCHIFGIVVYFFSAWGKFGPSGIYSLHFALLFGHGFGWFSLSGLATQDV
jgi:hypothetical protein